MSFLVKTILFLIFSVVHFLPAAIAYHRKHTCRKIIFVLNVVGAWVIVGWFIALLWARTDDVEPADVVISPQEKKLALLAAVGVTAVYALVILFFLSYAKKTMW